MRGGEPPNKPAGLVQGCSYVGWPIAWREEDGMDEVALFGGLRDRMVHGVDLLGRELQTLQHQDYPIA